MFLIPLIPYQILLFCHLFFMHITKVFIGIKIFIQKKLLFCLFIQIKGYLYCMGEAHTRENKRKALNINKLKQIR